MVTVENMTIARKEKLWYLILLDFSAYLSPSTSLSGIIFVVGPGGSSGARNAPRWYKVIWAPFSLSSKSLVRASRTKRHALFLHLRVKLVGKKVEKVSWSFQYLDEHSA